MPDPLDLSDEYFQCYEVPVFETTDIPSPDMVREQVSMPQVVSLYVQIQHGGKTYCLWHNDKRTPNLHIYHDGAFCFVCKQQYDIFDWVMKMEGLGFPEAVRFIADHLGDFPPVETVPAASRKTSANYKGPIPREWVDYWHSQLTPDRREWLYKERLLSDLTIDSKLIGWRPDYKAYVVPFWAGIPRYSEVVSLQYRSTPESPPVSGPNWHYTGHTGHNKPCIIGAHLINSDYMIGLIGTFDQLLAEQDGLPVFSPNGASVFGNHTRLESIELQRMFMDVRCKVVIPDTTPTEHIHAQGLAELIGGRVSYFPRDFGGKDYTDFRKLGFTPEDFVKMVLRDEQGFMYMLESNQVENCRLILQALSEGDPETSFEIMKVVAEASRYVFDPATIRPRISHTLQMLSIQALYPGFNPQEWSQIADEFSQTISFPEMAGVLKRWGEVASVRRGGF